MNTKILSYIFLLTLSAFAIQSQAQNCIGAQGQLKWYYWENIPGNDLPILYSHHSFPQSPDGFEIITELASPENYAEGLGALTKGYIKVDQTNTYTFNLTSSADGSFYLSTTSSPQDTVLRGEVTGWTNRDQHDKYPEQTSAPLNLVAGEYYYFELHQKDDVDWDYVRVYWKTSPTDDTWSVVPNINLYNYDCYDICPTVGTACDDGDANTVNDQEDGACNCVGVPSNLDNCVGEKGLIRAFYWDNIPGSDVSDLHEAPNYPMQPDRVETLTSFKGPTAAQGDVDEFGSRIQAMLIAPETGDYQFNMISDDNAWLYFSPSEDFELATVIAEVPGWTRDDEYDKYISQTSEVISLVKGQIYYIEVNHKEGGYGDRYIVSWKTPFNDTWKTINGFYLFSYACEVACTPQGTPCDDGDNTTHSDAYDANCNCVGIPCPNGDCSGFGYNPSFPAYEECGPTNKHNNQEEDSWLSCMPKANPNTSRGVTHWIQYDFNEIVSLAQSKIWNYNVPNQTASGFNQVVIDYSTDGTNWMELGQYNWQQAPGINDYEGFEGPDFGGIQARYVLITALNSFDAGGCMGFSQIQFETSGCANVGAICSASEEEPAVYDINCNCQSLSTPFNDCSEITLMLNATPISTSNYSARQTIESAGMINIGATVNMIAGESVTLKDGFVAKEGSKFWAAIIPCSTAQPPVQEELLAANNDGKIESRAVVFEDYSQPDLIIYPTPTNSWTSINFNLPKTEKINLSIFNNAGKRLYTLVNNQIFPEGSHEKNFPAQNLARGVYYVVLRTENGILTKSMVVVDTV